jgi:molecular chaperone DnaK (HSP70)
MEMEGGIMVNEKSIVKRKFKVSEDGKSHSSISRRVTVIERSKDELKTEIDNLEKFIKDREDEIKTTKTKCQEHIKDAKKLLRNFKTGYDKMVADGLEIPEGVA